MKTFLQLLEQANSEINQISCSELNDALGSEDLVLVDVRSKEIKIGRASCRERVFTAV